MIYPKLVNIHNVRALNTRSSGAVAHFSRKRKLPYTVRNFRSFYGRIPGNKTISRYFYGRLSVEHLLFVFVFFFFETTKYFYSVEELHSLV